MIKILLKYSAALDSILGVTQFSIAAFLNPGSVFFPPYLVIALSLTIAWLRRAQGLSLTRVFSLIFAKRVWCSKSTWLDLRYTFLFFMLMRTVAAGVETAVFLAALEWGGQVLARLHLGGFSAGPWIEGIIATIATMLAIDFASYVAHRLLHRWPILWQFHAVHHSAEHLTPFTTYRQHPIEPIFLNSVRGLFSGLALALIHMVLPNETPVITVFGLGAGFFIYMLTVNLHHFPVSVIYPRWMRGVLNSPHCHHIHHSSAVRHMGKNFGVVFSIWDRAFGTYCDEEVARESLAFGLGPDQNPECHGLWQTLTAPLSQAVAVLLAHLPASAIAATLLFASFFLFPCAALARAIGFL